jgi:hypothetical protein
LNNFGEWDKCIFVILFLPLLVNTLLAIQKSQQTCWLFK